MENMILTPVAVPELVNLIACEVEARLHRVEHNEPPQDRVDFDEARIILGTKEKPVSKSQLYKLSMQNKVPVKRFGKRLVFSRKELNDWMESRTVSTSNAGDVMSDRLAKSARKKLKK
jgi:predicted DNA-binding transcriptional regulator AlpA